MTHFFQQNIPAPEKLRRVLFGLLVVTMAFCPFGRMFQTAPPLLALPCLIALYATDWRNCGLRRLPIKWLFLLFWACLAIQLAFSSWPGTSWETMSPNFFRGYLLPLIGLECIRSEKDIRTLVVWGTVGAVLQGLDGVWQAWTGVDFVKGLSPLGNRLTGSFGTYRIGDYLGIVCLPACAIWYLLPIQNRLLRTIASFCLLSPALFLWVFAQARIGYLALLGGLYLLMMLILYPSRKIFFGLLPLLLFPITLFGPHRLSLELALSDGRIPIWITAWKTFLAAPWFGWGGGTFVPAYWEQGLRIAEGTMQHPHNIYLQFLVDGGIVGFLGLGTFLAIMTIWPFRRILKGVGAERTGELKSLHWHLAAFFWAGWLGFLIVGLAGHDFYRTWYVSTGFSMLGVVLGACVNGPQKPDVTLPLTSPR